MGACPWGVMGGKGGALPPQEGMRSFQGEMGAPHMECAWGGAPTWLHHGAPTAAPHLPHMLCLLPSEHQAWAADL